MLETGGVELGDIKNFSLTTDVIVLTGQENENCSISLVCSSDFYSLYETKLLISLSREQWHFRLTHTIGKNKKQFLQTYVDSVIARHNSYDRRPLNIGLQFRLAKGMFAQYYTSQYEVDGLLNYKENSPSVQIAQIKKLLTEDEEVMENIGTEDIKRNLTGAGCSGDFKVSLCPCSEPVITELSWNEETETLHCTAASIEGSENLNITWTENNTSVQNVTENFTNTELTKTSILKNVTSLGMSRDITCRVSDNVSRTITIPARSEDSEHPDGEASKDTDGENTNSQAFLTILITIIVVSVVAVALICVGVIKLVQHYKDNKTPEPPTLDAVEPTAGNSEVDEGAIIHLFEEDRGSGTQIESNYQDLEELLDAVEPRV